MRVKNKKKKQKGNISKSVNIKDKIPTTTLPKSVHKPLEEIERLSSKLPNKHVNYAKRRKNVSSKPLKKPLKKPLTKNQRIQKGSATIEQLPNNHEVYQPTQSNNLNLSTSIQKKYNSYKNTATTLFEIFRGKPFTLSALANNIDYYRFSYRIPALHLPRRMNIFYSIIPLNKYKTEIENIVNTISSTQPLTEHILQKIQRDCDKLMKNMLSDKETLSLFNELKLNIQDFLTINTLFATIIQDREIGIHMSFWGSANQSIQNILKSPTIVKLANAYGFTYKLIDHQNQHIQQQMQASAQRPRPQNSQLLPNPQYSQTLPNPRHSQTLPNHQQSLSLSNPQQRHFSQQHSQQNPQNSRASMQIISNNQQQNPYSRVVGI